MENQLDRITYSETRTVNVGDYESIKATLSYSTSVYEINEDESTIEIMASDTVISPTDKKSVDLNVKRAMGKVQSVLNKREAYIRARSARWTEHDTETKGMLFHLIALKAWKKLKKTIKVDIDEIDALDAGSDFIDMED